MQLYCITTPLNSDFLAFILTVYNYTVTSLISDTLVYTYTLV